MCRVNTGLVSYTMLFLRELDHLRYSVKDASLTCMCQPRISRYCVERVSDRVMSNGVCVSVCVYARV